MSDQQLYERINLLSEEVISLKEELEDNKQKIEQARRIAGDVVSALCNAIENGQQLHIGIVLGQSIKELQELQYS